MCYPYNFIEMPEPKLEVINKIRFLINNNNNKGTSQSSEIILHICYTISYRQSK